MSLRTRALKLYRACIRSSYRWPGPQEEKDYIRTEAQKLFREHRALAGREAEERVREGENRYEIAWHYQIPYPRLHHSPKQFKYKEPPIIEFGRQDSHPSK